MTDPIRLKLRTAVRRMRMRNAVAKHVLLELIEQKTEEQLAELWEEAAHLDVVGRVPPNRRL